jgi:hypothetical protein
MDTPGKSTWLKVGIFLLLLTRGAIQVEVRTNRYPLCRTHTIVGRPLAMLACYDHTTKTDEDRT